MAKRIQIGNSFYRMRRGVLVQIPGEWVEKLYILKQSESGNPRKKVTNKEIMK